MIFFGHLGLTGLVANLTEKSTEKIPMDYRAVLVGSILPDLLDKPIGRLLFANTFNTGRIFAHTLLFVLLLLGIGSYCWFRYRKTGWLVLAGSCLLHDVFDSMWVIPQTFLWPFFGLRFYTDTNQQWIAADLNKLLTDPAYYLSEITGFLITLYFIRKLVRRRQVKAFLRNGIIR